MNIFIAYLGAASKSGADIAREFKTQKRFARVGSAEEALKWIRDIRVKREDRFILFVDDFVGTGESARAGLLAFVNMLRKQDDLLQWAKAGRIFFVPLWGYTYAIDGIREEIGDLIRVEAARNLDDHDRAFHPSAVIFEDEYQRSYGETVFRHVGQQLCPDHPLGWGNTQSLVVFENTVPNNTLPPFWCSGVVDERPWKPLFQRP